MCSGHRAGLAEPVARAGHGAVAILAAAMGLFVAAHHPLWAAQLPSLFIAWALLAGLFPALWLAVVPALLPLASLSPWTGWIGGDEFDLLVLGALAGTRLRLLVEAPREAPSRRVRLAWSGLVGLACLYLLALGRGLIDVGSTRFDWFQGYEEPLNSLRVAKSFLLAFLLAPALRAVLRTRPALARRCLILGMVCGLAVTCAAIVWERGGYPGLFDFSTPYRTTALFWEMHVGGAALDAYLVLATPFAVYAVAHARDFRHWVIASLLALLAGYACLTTFSRGVYLGAALAVLCALVGERWSVQRRMLLAIPATPDAAVPRWRVWGNRLLILALGLELAVIVGIGEFMGTRLAAGERDLGGRLRHWSESLGLLADAADALFGIGLGRYPAVYSQSVPGRELPGRLSLVGEGGARPLRLLAAPGNPRLRGKFALLQRVPDPSPGMHLLTIELRAPRLAIVDLGLCRTHLLYAETCLRRQLVVPAGGEQWHSFRVPLPVDERLFPRSAWPRLAFLDLRLYGLADFVDIDELDLVGPEKRHLLANGNFSDGLARWFFAGHHYFLPWHVDNLFLEIVIEQGAIALFVQLTLVGLALRNLWTAQAHDDSLAPYLLGGLVGCLALGIVSSVLDMPRPAFLFHLLVCYALLLDPRRSPGAPRSATETTETADIV